MIIPDFFKVLIIRE